MNEREIFIEALHKTAVDQRAFLDKTCGTTGEIRERIDALLNEATELDDFLESPLSCSNLRSDGRIGEQIGPYRLTDEIGDGGMGTVYLAEQTNPFKRQVAIKIVKFGIGSSQVVARFEIERRALAVMDHPNIARVFDGGTTSDGHPYFVMELIDGPSIIQYCDRNALSLNDRLQLLIDVCRAVQHAHQKGIIHRDLKPSNILVTTVDGRAVPKVIDFGVAKAIGKDDPDWSSSTRFGQIIGTLEYMSPEQARQGRDVDTRTDIYSLGVLAYELLTGTTPLKILESKDAEYSEILRNVCEVEPIRPSTWQARSHRAQTVKSSTSGIFYRQLRDELDWIVMKCLEKDRSRRYETVEMLARDIQRFLDGDPVDARPAGKIYRIKKFVRRHSTAVIGLAGILILFIAGFVATATQAVRAMRAEGRLRDESTLVRNERDRALVAEQKAEREKQAAELARRDEEGHRKDAEQLSDRSKHQSYSAQINLAFRAWKDGSISRSLVLLEGLRPRFDEPDSRTFEWYFLWRACYQGLVARWEAGAGQVTALRFLDNDNSLVIAGWSGLRVWDIDLDQSTVQQRVRFGAGSTWALAVSPDKKSIASGTTLTDPLSVYYWDLASGLPQLTRRESIVAVRGLAYSSDGHWLAGVGGNGLTVWNADPQYGEKELLNLSCRAVAFSQNRDFLAAGSDKGSIHLWRVHHGEFEKHLVLQGHNELVRSLAFSPDGTLLASSSRDVKIWNLESGESSSISQPNTSIVPSVDFSPDGAFLAIASEDRTARVWHVGERAIVRTYPHDSPLSAVKFSPSGRLLATATHSGSVELWNREDFGSVTTIMHGAEVTAANFLSDGQRLLTVERESTRVWSLVKNQNSAEEVASWTGQESRLSTDRSLIGTVNEQRVEIRDAETLQRLNEFPLKRSTRRIELSYTGDVMAALEHGNGLNSSLDFYQISTGAFLRSVEPLGSNLVGLPCMTFNRQGTKFAIGQNLWWVVVQDVTSHQQQLLLTHDRASLVGVTAVVFSENGLLIATGTSTGTIRIWDATSGKLISMLAGHTDIIKSIAFSSDNKSLASASNDGSVRLWDVMTGSERATLIDSTGSVNSVEFDEVGETLVTGSASGEVRLWQADYSPLAQSTRPELNPNDPKSAAGIGSLALQADIADQFDQAIELYKNAEDRWRKVTDRFPDRQVYRQHRFYNRYLLSRLWIRVDKFELAEKLLVETIESERNVVSNQDRYFGRVLALLGTCYLRQQRFAEAREVLNESSEICHNFEPDSFETHHAEYLFGLSLIGSKELEAGEKMLLQARTGLQRRQHLHADAARRIEVLDHFKAELYESLKATDQRPPDLNVP